MALDVTLQARRTTLKSILFRKRLLATIDEAIDKTINELPMLTNTIAKKKGLMRTAIKQNLIDQVKSQRGEKHITISLSNAVIDQISQNIFYTAYHTPGHPEFNPNFSVSHYKNPTTPGTKPIARREIIRGISTSLRTNIKIGLKRAGFI